MRRKADRLRSARSNMQKKYIITLTSLMLCLIFLLAVYLLNIQQQITVTPIEAFNQNEKISFISSWGAYDSKAQRLKSIFQKLYEKYPNIKIEDSSMAGKDFLFILKTDFANGNEPDLFGLWPGSDFTLLVEQGKVADLTELVKSDEAWYKQFKESTWDYVTVDNRIYGLPIEIIYEGLFINKDLFDKHNVKIPTNFQELLQAVEVFKREGIIPIAYSETPEGSYIYQNMVMKLGGKEDVENPIAETGYIKPCFIEAMYYMKELYEAGAFPEHLWSIDDKERNELFFQKKAAMIVQGSWLIGDNALSSQDQTIEIIPFPDMPDGKAESTAIIYGCGNGIFHISQKAWEDPEMRKNCSLILKEITSPQNVALLAEGSGFISNIELGEYAIPTTLLGEKGEELVNNAKELVGPVDSFINRGIWEDIIIERFPSVLKGTMTPEAVFDEVYRAMKFTKGE